MKMEIASLKHHHMVECENCGKLIIFAGSSEQSIEALDNLLERHLNKNPPCREWYDSLPTLKDIRDLVCFKEADFTLDAEKEQKMDALINTVKDNLTFGPVCDSVYRCAGWEADPGAETDKYCKHCGRERTWREKS